MSKYHKKNECRICSSSNLKLILDLGEQPPSNAFIKKENLEKYEDKFPLRLYLCKECYLLQLLDIVDKEILFKEYLYLTSASKPSVNHFEKYAYEIFEESAIIDRNLLDHDYHIKIYRKDNQILIQNNINYWNELEDIKSHKFIISFFNKNRNYLEFYIPLILEQFKRRDHIMIDIPSTVKLTNTKIHINSNQLKIKYENTSN